MSTTNWTPRPGEPCPPERYTQSGPHAFVDEDELARRRAVWHTQQAAPPPEKDEAPEAATAGASEGTDESTTSEADGEAPAHRYPHGPAPDQYAIDWAFDQDAGGPGPKLVLVALARHCFKPGDTLAWPTAETIGRLADMRRTAVLDNLSRLEALGLIQDTGTRKGRTGRVIVWRLGNSPESVRFNGADSGPFNHPDSAPLGGKWSGIRQEMVRNPDPEYPPKGGGGGAASAAAGAAAAAPRVDLPQGLDPALFAHWTDGQSGPAVQRLIAHARVLAQGGHDLNALCRQAIEERWKLWPKARGGRTKPARPKSAAQPVGADDWSMPP
ncbi:MAG: helix-turn-helix domain-containing protein [Methylotenera sp.]|nr:helix-turn-helix domain-containing protein [Methylotenera sp.]